MAIDKAPGIPYMEITPNGTLWEFIDLGESQFCVLGLTEEQLKEIKNKQINNE